MATTTQLPAQLEQGLAALGLALTPAQQQQLLDYLAMLHKWNKVYNLTSVREPADMLRLHLLDCLAVLAPFQRALAETPSPKVLDVGAGGGLPGVVLAIGCPEVTVRCVDAVAKKMAFVRQASSALALPNLQAIHARVEDVRDRYSLITSRAFASLADFAGLTAPLLQEGGVWMAMKGKHPHEEIAELQERAPEVEVLHVEPLQVPGLDAERCLVWMRPASLSS